MDFRFRQNLPIARFSHIFNIQDAYVQRAKYTIYNPYLMTYLYIHICIRMYICITYILHYFNIDQSYIIIYISTVHPHSFSNIHNTSTIPWRKPGEASKKCQFKTGLLLLTFISQGENNQFEVVPKEIKKRLHSGEQVSHVSQVRQCFLSIWPRPLIM
jgi:hypothetical protein